MHRPKIRSEYLAFGRPNFSDAEIAAVTAVMRSGWVGMGPQTIAFETELASVWLPKGISRLHAVRRMG